MEFGNLSYTYEPEAIVISPDGKNWVWAGPLANLDSMLNPDNVRTVVDVQSAKPVMTMSTPRHLRTGLKGTIIFSPDRRWIAFACHDLFVFVARTGDLWTGSDQR